MEKFSRICILVSRKEKEEEEERVLGSAPRGVPNMHVPKQGQELGGGVKSSSKMVTLKLQAITSLNPFVNFHFANENIRLCHLVKKERGGWKKLPKLESARTNTFPETFMLKIQFFVFQTCLSPTKKRIPMNKFPSQGWTMGCP